MVFLIISKYYYPFTVKHGFSNIYFAIESITGILREDIMSLKKAMKL